MAYSWNRMLIFGGAGIAIAALIIIFFIPVKTEIHMDPLVSLQEIPGYGFQIVKISEEQTDLIHFNLTLEGFEVKGADGKWIKIDIETVSFNLLRDPGTSITVDAGSLDPGRYTAVRFQVLGGLDYTNATLTNGDVVSVDVPSSKLELTTGEFDVGEGREGFILVLRLGPGQLVNHMLPDYHISIGTMRVEVACAGGFGIYLTKSGELVKVPGDDLGEPLRELDLGDVEVARGGVGHLVELLLRGLDDLPVVETDVDVVQLGHEVEVPLPRGVPEVDSLAVGQYYGLVPGRRLPPPDDVRLGVGVEVVHLVLRI